ncbi:MAG: sigma-70 family RNA polymerase sigma factor [Enhygromyxa sp.]
MSPAPAKHSPALEAAFTEHRAFVRERLRGLGVASAELDDATQDVFEVLVRRIADYDPNRPIRAWMAGMARKVARRYRDRGRRAVVSLDERRPGSDASPEDRAAQNEARQVLQRFLDQLEPERWAVFVLSEIEGLRGSEIAAELGVNQNTVYARLRSARSAFDRALRRHRARDRRGVAWALLWWPSSESRRWWPASLGLIGSVTLGVGALAQVRCAGEGSIEEPAPSRAESRSSEPASGGEASLIGRPKPRALGSDAAGSSGSEGDPWIAGSSGFSEGSNASGERYTLSFEARYQLEGDRVIFEITYVGDDEVELEAIGHELTVDGLDVIDGPKSWELAVPAAELRTVTTTLRATREGVVRLRATAKHPRGGGSGSRRYAWINQRGLLRSCEDHECQAPVGEEQLCGERITVHVHNECSITQDFVLFAGYPEVRPDDSVRVYSMQPGERRSLEIDAAQWFLHRNPDGTIGGGVHIDQDGARVRFSGTGDQCSQSSARSPDWPPEGDASPIRG